MRLTNYLLVAAAALLASSEAVSADTDSAQDKLSTLASPDVVQTINVDNGGKRFLRTTKTPKYDEDDDDDDDLDSGDDNDDDSDERGLRFFMKSDDEILEQLRLIPGGKKKIIGWKQNELDPSDVKGLLGLTSTKNLQDPDVRLYKIFLVIHARQHFKLN